MQKYTVKNTKETQFVATSDILITHYCNNSLAYTGSVFSGISFPVHFRNSKILKTLFPDDKKFIIPSSKKYGLSHMEKQIKVLLTNE